MLAGLPVAREQATSILAVRVETPVEESKAALSDVTKKGFLPQPVLVSVDATPLANDDSKTRCHQVAKVLRPDVVEIVRKFLLVKVGHVVLSSTISGPVDL